MIVLGREIEVLMNVGQLIPLSTSEVTSPISNSISSRKSSSEKTRDLHSDSQCCVSVISCTSFPLTFASYLNLSSAVRNDTVVIDDDSWSECKISFSDTIDFLFVNNEHAPMAASATSKIVG